MLRVCRRRGRHRVVAQQLCQTTELASIFDGRRVKPLKPDETVHETAWQVCETGETGIVLIKNEVP